MLDYFGGVVIVSGGLSPPKPPTYNVDLFNALTHNFYATKLYFKSNKIFFSIIDFAVLAKSNDIGPVK